MYVCIDVCMHTHTHTHTHTHKQISSKQTDKPSVPGGCLSYRIRDAKFVASKLYAAFSPGLCMYVYIYIHVCMYACMYMCVYMHA